MSEKKAADELEPYPTRFDSARFRADFGVGSGGYSVDGLEAVTSQMKALLVIVLAVAMSGASVAGVCKGEDPCKACSNCSACWYCSAKNPQRGSCGVVKAQADQAYEEAKKARAKTLFNAIVDKLLKKPVDTPPAKP